MFDEEWIARFTKMAEDFSSFYGPWCGVRPSYYHVQCVYALETGGTQIGISMKVPDGADVAAYVAEIDRRRGFRKDW